MTANTCEWRARSPRREKSLAPIEQLKILGQLPSPNGVALAIMEICRREDASTDDISRVVKTDPVLTSRLVRLANSAAVNTNRPVVSISDAIQRLGTSTLRQVSMGFSLVDQYQSGPCKAFDYSGFWSHSLLMAVAMQTLGALSRIGQADEMFTCGLLARIGCLALATIHPVEYANLLEQSNSEAELSDLEQTHLQADHNDFTTAILCDCGMPKIMVEAIYHHETPDQSGFSEGSRPYQLVHLFHYAKRVADMGLAAKSERNGIISEMMMIGGKLGLDSHDLGDHIDRIIEQWHEWSELLKVPSSDLPPFATMASAPAPKVEDNSAISPAMRVLLVEDEPTSRAMLQELLASIVGHTVYAAENGQDAMALAVQVMPHIVITDWLMPVMDGIEFCRALRATDWGQSMYVIMLTGVDTEEQVVDAFEAGVDDYVAKPVNIRAMRARMRAALHYVQLLEAWERDRAQLKQFAAELAITNRKLEHYALTDLLTGLPNRRAGMDILGQAWSAANRSGHTIAVMMVDIDRFKLVNDTYGHAVGDKVLIEVGKLLRAAARKDDYVCRMGGEEFLVICQNSDLKATFQAAERLRYLVNNTHIMADDIKIQTSISVGVASKEANMADTDMLLITADNALYAAKQAGRNRSCLYSGGKLLCGSP